MSLLSPMLLRVAEGLTVEPPPQVPATRTFSAVSLICTSRPCIQSARQRARLGSASCRAKPQNTLPPPCSSSRACMTRWVLLDPGTFGWLGICIFLLPRRVCKAVARRPPTRNYPVLLEDQEGVACSLSFSHADASSGVVDGLASCAVAGQEHNASQVPPR